MGMLFPPPVKIYPVISQRACFASVQVRPSSQSFFPAFLRRSRIMSAAPAPEVHLNGAAGLTSGGMGFRVGSYTRLDEQHPPSFIKGYLAVLEDVVSHLPGQIGEGRLYRFLRRSFASW